MARNRNRQPGPILRNVVTPTPRTTGTDPSLRTPSRIVVTGPGPRLGRAKGGGQPSGNGSGMSDWSRPMFLPASLSMLTNDRRWSDTTNNIGI